MPSAPCPRTVFIRIDRAAASCTRSWASADTVPCPVTTSTQTPDGFQVLQTHRASTGHAPTATRSVRDATGSSWGAVAVDLHTAGYPIRVAHPRHGHAVAQSLPRRAKTDARAAHLLVQVAQERAAQVLRGTPPPAV